MLPVEHPHSLTKPSFLITVGTGEWALSCHNINTVITLSSENIRWLNNSGARRWLAGTSLEKRCGILNISELIDLVEAQILA